ncbi:valacyclovir hydrolase [Folsomia candida]|uniref:valacyclovir hydrolase n=1 Tax=Folsomia candida TaxID=158441 RepID=UPI000B9063D9|nr:valacyclovir hydrolase [Folsomia candida]
MTSMSRMIRQIVDMRTVHLSKVQGLRGLLSVQSGRISVTTGVPATWGFTRTYCSKPYSTEAAVKMETSADPPTDAHDLRGLGMRREKIEVDGIQLNWDQAGDGDHVVLLLPGIIGCIKHDFVPIFKKMNKDKFTLVSWDPPGYGYSRPPQRDFTGIPYRRDGHLVVKLMEKLGHKSFSALGWSNGGVTAGHIAADYPDHVRNIVTWGAHAFADERCVMFTKFMGDLDAWSPKMLEPVLALYGREYLVKMMADWHKGVHDFYHNKEDQVFKDGLPKIKCPALILHGEDDPVLGEDHAEYLRDNIKNSRMVIMPNAKHNLHLKFTDEFVNLVENFLLEGDEPKQ